MMKREADGKKMGIRGDGAGRRMAPDTAKPPSSSGVPRPQLMTSGKHTPHATEWRWTVLHATTLPGRLEQVTPPHLQIIQFLRKVHVNAPRHKSRTRQEFFINQHHAPGWIFWLTLNTRCFISSGNAL